MIKKIAVIVLFGVLYISINGCMYRGDGVFKQIGDSDYKARLSFQNMLVAADGTPTNITGTVFSDDMITPVKYTPVILRKKDQQKIVTRTKTDNVGRFVMSGILSNDDYIIEIDSLEYTASKTILVEPNRTSFHEMIARKK